MVENVFITYRNNPTQNSFLYYICISIINIKINNKVKSNFLNLKNVQL